MRAADAEGRTIPAATETEQSSIDEIAAALGGASSVLFITGAGVSADSGLPTYRGIGGLYEERDTEEGIPIEVALSGEMLARRPEVTWRHLLAIERACRGRPPNRAHEVIAEVERRIARTWVLTQNVDGLHAQAGSRQLIEIHGCVDDLLCTRCPWTDRVGDYSAFQIPPRCPHCGALVRPKVVLFGELLLAGPLATLQEQLAIGFDIVFSVGTTSVFPYIQAPVRLARKAGRLTVEVNPGRTEVSDLVDVRLAMGAAAALDAIWRACPLSRA